MLRFALTTMFFTVGAATEKARVPAFIFTRAIVDRGCLGYLAGVSIEFRYAGCVDEMT